VVIGQRLKQSGMHWTADSADVIITLRCQQTRRPHLKRTAHPDSSRLTSATSLTILVTYKNDAHPLIGTGGHAVGGMGHHAWHAAG
jgi:hypothetical protein